MKISEKIDIKNKMELQVDANLGASTIGSISTEIANINS